MFKTSVIYALLIFLSIVFAEQAWPHAMDKVGISVKYQDQELQIIANIPVQVFTNNDEINFLDSNRDGRVSLEDVLAQGSALTKHIEANILLLDQNVQVPLLLNIQTSGLDTNLIGQTKTAGQVAYIKAVLDYAWEDAPDVIDFRYGLIDTLDPIHIQVLDYSNKVLSTADLNLEHNYIRIKELAGSFINNTEGMNKSAQLQDV